MKPSTTASLTTGLLLAAFHAASAQIDTSRSPRHDFAISAGIARTDQLDATASPLAFGGQGSELLARYARRSDRTLFSIAAGGGMRGLSSTRTAVGAGERLTAGDIAIGLERVVARTPGVSSFSLGAELSGAVNWTAHRYQDPTQAVSNFIIGTVTLGPAATMQRAFGGGVARIGVSVPLVGVVDHPYSDSRGSNAAIQPRFATASSLRGGTLTLAYAPAATRRIGLEYAYRIRVLDYADLQPMRTASQSLLVGIVTRFGGAGR